MKSKFKKWSYPVLIVVVLLLLLIPTYRWSKNNVKELSILHNSKLSPVIMIPGSSATENRFDSMVKEINATSLKKHSLLKVKVYDDGEISYSGKIRQNDDEPFIVIGFQNNKDGYSNILKQAKMFNEAFGRLQKTYNFNNFKAIGHSNGGLVYTAFFEKYFSQYSGYVQAKKLMTIGTPYNFAEDSIDNKTQMLADFIKDRKKIPSNLIVYSVAGTENYTSDGLVPEQSVEAGKYIYQGQVKHFTQITITGSNAQHSDLPQNTQIIDLIKRYILNKTPGIEDKKKQLQDSKEIRDSGKKKA